MATNSGTTSSARLQEFRAKLSELTQPRDFGITLTCPDCGSPSLKDYVCQNCSGAASKAQGKSTALFEAGGALVTILLGTLALGGVVFLTILGRLIGGSTGSIVGFLIGLSMAKMEMIDLRRSLAQGRGVRTSGLSLASRYRLNPETYNQAALLYYNWVIAVSPIKSPDGFIEFLRCYRCSNTANPELREALFDAVLAQAVAQLSKSDAGLKSLLDASFTGSSVQKTTLQLITAWKDTAEDSVYSIRPIIWEIEKAHAKGIDTQGRDLRLPSGAALVKQIQYGLSLAQAVGPERIEAATDSAPYLKEVSNKLIHTKWSDRQRIAAMIRDDSAQFAQKLAGAVKSDTTWTAYLVFAFIAFIVLAFSAWINLAPRDPSQASPVGGFMCAALAFLITGSFIALAIRDRRRKQFLIDRLSGA